MKVAVDGRKTVEEAVVGPCVSVPVGVGSPHSLHSRTMYRLGLDVWLLPRTLAWRHFLYDMGAWDDFVWFHT